MNPYDNDPRNDEAFDLDGLLDDAFASRRVPVLSPSLMDVRRRARHRRNRTRATGLAAVACVSVGGVAVLVNNRQPTSKPAVGAGVSIGAEEPCAPESVVPTTTVLEMDVPRSTVQVTDPATTILDTTSLPPASTAALVAGFVADPTLSGEGELFTTTTEPCSPKPTGGFRCTGDSTDTQDGWTYYEYCESVDNLTVPTYLETTTTSLFIEVVEFEQAYVVQFGDYLLGIARLFCANAGEVAVYNAWPEGVEHPLSPGDTVKIPPGSCRPANDESAVASSTTGG
jgi:hypothetical protein